MNEEINLYYTEGGSDKVYQAQLTAQDDGFVVTFQYGRRGGSLKAGSKTPEPLPLEKAKKVYDKLVQSKVSKGYTPSLDGVTYTQTTDEARKTAYIPQLLNPTDDPAHFIENDAFWGQEKHDGERLILDIQGEVVVGINKRGLTRAIPKELEAEAQALDAVIVLDGELVGDKFHVFDVIMPGTYAERLRHLHDVVAESDHIEFVKTLSSTADKQALFDDIEARGGEGMVFKRSDVPYKAGRPSSGGDQIKFKFTESASVVIIGVNEGKRSVPMGILDDGIMESIGNVTIPANHEIPEVGAIIEVEYLYAYPRGSLYQPVYKGPRTDIPHEDCVIQQLKFKAQGTQND